MFFEYYIQRKSNEEIMPIPYSSKEQALKNIKECEGNPDDFNIIMVSSRQRWHLNKQNQMVFDD